MFKVSGQANVVVIFLIAIGILCLNAYYIYQSIDRMKNQAVWVADTQELIGGLEELVSYVKDVQSAPRGYVITGQKDYLSSYNSAIPDINPPPPTPATTTSGVSSSQISIIMVDCPIITS